MSNPPLSNTEAQRARIEGRISTEKTEALAIASGNLAFANVADMMEFAKIMSISGVAVPKHLRENPGACLAIVIQSSEWSMSPFAVANKSYSVNDRLAYESQMVNAVILRRAPIRGRFRISYSGEGSNRKCKVEATTTDGEIVEYESPAIGLITVKNSPLWKSDPDQQLFYFSSRAMCRRHFPDVLLGVYTADEIEEELPPRNVTPGASGPIETIDPFGKKRAPEPAQAIEATVEEEDLPWGGETKPSTPNELI